MTGPARGAADGLALSVHGPAGVLDLLVPAGACVSAVAVEYAAQAGLPVVPTICTRLGERLGPERPLDELGIGSGQLLVAMTATERPRAPGRRRRVEPARAPDPFGSVGEPGALSVVWHCVSVALALAGGWVVAQEDPSAARTTAVALLIGAAVVGVLPFGRLSAHRVLAAPAFAAAAAFVVAWDPAPERLPSIIGVAALTAALTAALARALDTRSEEALRVWVLAGVLVFGVTCGAALLDLRPQVAWALLLLLALLAARVVPLLAIDVPDHLLLDLERLAVTAWSARDRPRARRGRIVVPPRAVEAVAARGTRTVAAAAVAVLVTVTVSAPLLLATATQRHDWWGARCLVGLAGATFVLTARSHRHGPARWLLRCSGLACLTALLAVVLTHSGPVTVLTIALLAIGVAALLVLAAVALGRGWRSAWWARRAEVAEAFCGSVAVGSIVVAVGLFRHLWESTG